VVAIRVSNKKRAAQVSYASNHTTEVPKEAIMAAVATADERRDALVGRLFEATLGAFDLLAVYIGDRLGL
jgi:hypothetical protein